MNISIIIPCYNGGLVLKNRLPKLCQYLKGILDHRFKIIVVNDGSSDNTQDILRETTEITLLSYNYNKGKGGAIQYGIQHIEPCDAVIFMDADFSTGLNAIEESINELSKYDIVIGSRCLKNSHTSNRSLKRKIVSKCCNVIVNTMFHLHLKDTQCGFKCFKFDVAKLLASKQKIYDFAFDVEYLYISRLHNYKIKEIPVVWSGGDQSTLKIPSTSFKFIKSLKAIKRNKRNGLYQ